MQRELAPRVRAGLLEGCKPSCVSCSDTKGLANDAGGRAAQGAARTMPQSLVEAWPLLPEAVRTGIVAMANCAFDDGQQYAESPM